MRNMSSDFLTETLKKIIQSFTKFEYHKEMHIYMCVLLFLFREIFIYIISNFTEQVDS